MNVQHEIEIILMRLKTTGSKGDYELLERIFNHHLHRSQESINVLCKLLEDYQRGELDTSYLLLLAQWT
jgi:hypothetical protein